MVELQSIATLTSGAATGRRAEIERVIDEFSTTADLYGVERAYYLGVQQIRYSSEKLARIFGSKFRAFSDNLVATVVDALTERIQLDGFTSADARVSSMAAEIFRRARLGRRSVEFHRDVLIDGDGYLIIWPDQEGWPVFYPNRADLVRVWYDEEQPGYIRQAAKLWRPTPNVWRLTLYYPDRIERYAADADSDALPKPRLFEPLADAPVIPNPYEKVPVYHFSNRGATGQRGRSEIADVVPLQDALNKLIADVIVASEFYALPQRYAVGLLPEEARMLRVEAASIIGLPEGAQVGQFPQADLGQLLNLINDFRLEIARLSRTPVHYFALDQAYPSGEALRTAEMPFRAKIAARQQSWGAVWEDAMRFALRVMGIDEAQVTAIWRDTTPVSPAERIAEAQAKLALGIPAERVWQELGYSPAEVEAFVDAKEEGDRQQSVD